MPRTSDTDTRQETADVSRDRDDLLDQRETARAYAAGAPADGEPRSDSHADPDDSRQGGLHLFGRQPARRHRVAETGEPLNGQVDPDAPADTPAP